jgi:hypothetical protein
MVGVQNILSGNQAAATSSAAALRTLVGLGRTIDAHDPAVARQAAGQLVSELFFKPLLAEMRQFPLGRELATGGYTESVFGEQLDQRLADAAAQAHPALLNAVQAYFDAARSSDTAALVDRRPGPGAAGLDTRHRLEVYA